MDGHVMEFTSLNKLEMISDQVLAEKLDQNENKIKNLGKVLRGGPSIFSKSSSLQMQNIPQNRKLHYFISNYVISTKLFDIDWYVSQNMRDKNINEENKGPLNYDSNIWRTDSAKRNARIFSDISLSNDRQVAIDYLNQITGIGSKRKLKDLSSIRSLNESEMMNISPENNDVANTVKNSFLVSKSLNSSEFNNLHNENKSQNSDDTCLNPEDVEFGNQSSKRKFSESIAYDQGRYKDINMSPVRRQKNQFQQYVQNRL